MNLSLYKFYSISNFYVDSIKIKEEPTGKMTINVKEIANKKSLPSPFNDMLPVKETLK
jgi:hypothetical protein